MSDRARFYCWALLFGVPALVITTAAEKAFGLSAGATFALLMTTTISGGLIADRIVRGPPPRPRPRRRDR
ncbi:MAG: hypothetical protein QOI91_1101 [Solirubrobacteraceae bacterium]|nr:hypothetical protein [Solirubrobacteraceae bacterium]